MSDRQNRKIARGRGVDIPREAVRGCRVTYLKRFPGEVTILGSSSISSDSSGSLVLTTISSNTASSPSFPGPGSAAGRRGFRGIREAVLLRRDEDEVATGKFGLPRAELGRREDADDAGDANLDEFWGAVELLLRLRVDLLRFPMPLFCPDRVPRELVPIMMCGNRLPLEREYRICRLGVVVVYQVVGDGDVYGEESRKVSIDKYRTAAILIDGLH